MSEHRFIEYNDVPEKIIETEGTIFGILIKAHKLVHVRENIYKSPGGRKYHLTKYGLEPNVLHNQKIENRKIQGELEKVSENLVKANKRIDGLKREIVHKSEKLEKQKKQLDNQAKALQKKTHKENKLAKNIEAILDTGLSDEKKLEQIKLLL